MFVKPWHFVLDIDSTIADNEHRASLLEAQCLICGNKQQFVPNRGCTECAGVSFKMTPESCKAFMDPALMLKDKPIQKAQELVQRLKDEKFEYIFLTGRNEKYRTVTQVWLNKHFDTDAPLLMRGPAFEGVPASVYKEQQLKQHIHTLWSRFVPEDQLFDYAKKYKPFIIFDDDPYVLIRCAQYGMTFKAPECWSVINPTFDLEQEEPAWAR